MTNFERLREFHETIDGEVPNRPTVPSERVLELRESLVREEYTEMMKALRDLRQLVNLGKATDISSLVHELTDLLYVTYGTLVEFGVDADEIFDEVHRANMRKLAGPKRADGKQLKPDGWQPADVAGVISRQRKAQAHSKTSED